VTGSPIFADRMSTRIDVENPAMGEQGISLEELNEQLSEARERSAVTIERGDMTYYSPGTETAAAAKAGVVAFFQSNALYRDRYPAVVQFEAELITTAATLMHAPEPIGTITSGGTESIFLAVASARERARAERPSIERPEMVVPYSAHPAFWKAGHMLGVEVIETPLGDDMLPDLDAFEQAFTPRTIFAMGSTPSFPTTLVEPIALMAEIASAREVPFHMDACMGGFFLPFVEQLGAIEQVPDFRVPGVTSISADFHKFGYSYAKGASVLLHREQSGYDYQRWEFRPHFRGDADTWYVTPGLAGSRSGSPIAAAWAVMRFLGRDGFLARTRETLDMMQRFSDGLDEIEGMRLVVPPAVPLISYTSDPFDIFLIAHGMAERGWVVHPDEWPVRCMRNMFPIGMTDHIDRFLGDLAELAGLANRGDLVTKATVSY
jgi:sphinganine-1-phosphate aldolase